MNVGMKGISPFYPGQPVPVDFFVGRQKEIEKIKSTTFRGRSR